MPEKPKETQSILKVKLNFSKKVMLKRLTAHIQIMHIYLNDYKKLFSSLGQVLHTEIYTHECVHVYTVL